MLRGVFLFMVLVYTAVIYGQQPPPLPFDGPRLNTGVIENELNAAAPVTLTRIPTKFYTNHDSSSSGTLTISWVQPGIFGDLYYSRNPNVAKAANPAILSDNANTDRSITFNVGEAGITTGVYYCVIADRSRPDSTSIEFNLIIEHDLSPSNFTPTGNALSSDGLMQWQASHTYTPFYHVVVSDQRIRVENIDDDPDYEITGINIVYQAITPNTYITYRDIDPSGSFENAATPRLASGKTYYWLVFNNYGNSPAMTSDVVTFLQAPSFVYSNQAEIQAKPENLVPADDAVIGQNETLTFSWSEVSNSIYHFYLYEEREVEGNRASYLYYDTTLATGKTSFTLKQASQLLVNTNYNWNVTAENGVRYSASDLSSFTYTAPAVSMLKIKIRSDAPGNPDVGRVNLDIRNVNAPTSNIKYLTDESGYFEREVQSGTYRITARKEGFFTTDSVIAVSANNDFTLNLILRENPTFFTGIIQIPDISVVPYVYLSSTSGEENIQIIGKRTYTGNNSSQFSFRANVNPGEWRIYPFAKGFRAAPGDTIVSSIQFGDYLELPVLDLLAIGSNIIVNVTDNTGKPLVDVTLTFTHGNSQQIIFATDLPYVFPAEPGTWTVEVEKSGYFSQSDKYQVEVLDKQDSPLDVIMVRAAYISGLVLDDEGSSLSDVLIEAVPQDILGRYTNTNSRNTGNYGPLYLKPGSYRVMVSKDGYSTADTTVTVAALDSVRYNPVLSQFTSAITGTVSDESNNPLPGARIAYRLADGSGMSVLTESDGSYRLRVPSNIEIKISASKEKYGTIDTSMTVLEGETATINFALHKLSAVIYGEILTIEANKLVAVAQADISVRDPVTEEIIYSDQSDGEGQYKVYCDEGTILLRVEKAFYTTSDSIFSVNAGDSLYVPFTLGKTVGIVSGSVKTSSNAAVSNQEITATRKSNGNVVRVVTNNSGIYQFTSLLPGETYTITTKKLRYFTAPAEGYTIQVTGGNTGNINFVLSKATITSLVMQYPSKSIANNQQVRFYVQAYAGDKPVAIEPPRWKIDFLDSVRYQTATFSTQSNGLFIPAGDALDAGLSITAVDTAGQSGLSVTEDGFSIIASLSRRIFSASNVELKDHSGMRLVVDSTDIDADVGATISLKRPVLPRSKAVSAANITSGNSFLLGGMDNISGPLALYLPILKALGLADFRQAQIGRWDNKTLSWETLEDPEYRLSPYTMVYNTINQDGEYIVFARSEKLGIKNLKLLPNPFSPNLENFNDPLNRRRQGQVITFNLTSRDLSYPYVTLKIYNMNGELIRSLADHNPMEKGLVALIWDGKTEDNRIARNGRYLVHIKVEDSSGEKEELKSSVLIK